MRELTINGRLISDDAPAYLIAEVGANYGPDREKVFDMIDTAKASGADAVKFQTRTPSEVYARGTQRGAFDWQGGNPNWLDPVYGRHRELQEFTYGEWLEVFEYARSKGITAFSTPFDHKSVDLLARLGVPAIKIASGDATNIPLIEHAASVGVPLIISTGGCDIADVDRVAEAMGRTSTPFALLQCSCIYPAPPDVLNLRVVSTYRSRYPRVVTGLSTHSPDWTPTLAAYTLGGRIFEHHYTNDRSWRGTDNHFSLTPDTLRALRDACDMVRPALGSGQKCRDPREDAPTFERRKALYWRRQVMEGQQITADDLIALCPYEPGAIEPYHLASIVGFRAAHTTGEGERVAWQDVLVDARDHEAFQRAVISA